MLVPRSHNTPIPYLRVFFPFQVVTRLVQVHKYFLQDLFPHGCYVLKQFVLEGSSTCAITRPETMEDVVKVDGGCEVAIDNHHR